MSEFPPLESFGRRIMICGPSNAGKSTLCRAIGRRLGVPPVHLDQLYHTPNTDWVPRPKAEFVALHDAAIAGDEWVMDGNYSSLIPARAARATGIILVTSDRFSSLGRYLRRTLFERQRVGALSGNRDSLKWNMIHFIAVRSPPSQRRLRETLPGAGRPFVEVRAMQQLNRLYAEWDLTRG